jgi:transcriptional regulator with XRE-family HTH domain
LASAKKRRRLRQQQRRAAAGMLAAGMTQIETADALGVTDRTIRNWAKDKTFQSALARAQARVERQEANAERRAARRRAALEQQNAARRPELRGERDPDSKPDPRRAARANQSDYARWLDARDARLPLSRADLHSHADRVAASTVAAGGGIQAIIEATGLRTRENVLRRIDPAILEQARQNDTSPPAAPPAPG